MKRFLPALGATLVLLLVVVTRTLDPAPRGIAIGCIAAAWLAPLVFSRRIVGAHASVVASVAALTAAGQLEAGLPYGIACGVVLLGAAMALRRARTTGAIPAPRAKSVVVIGVIAAGVTGGFVSALPPLAARVQRHIENMLSASAAGDEQTAFSSSMRLGATRGMLQNDTVVMRIAGPAPEYLRGAVYDVYSGLSWTTSARGATISVVDSHPGARPSRAVLSRDAPEGQDMRWFLPADACELVTSNASVEIDAFGIARRAKVERPATIAWRTDCAPPPIALPGPNDTDLARALRPQLQAIAEEWTANAPTPRAKLEAIIGRLARYDYSLDVPRGRIDPVLDFLTVHRAGHCEYFASALALLARSEGIPARVVGGYRASEVNPLTGRTIVRERNAHAWVEAWVDGAWRGFDPTPASDLPRPRRSLADDVVDLVAMKWMAFVMLLERLGPLGVVAIGAAGVGIWFFVRVLFARLHTRRRRRLVAAGDLPLPCFDRLSAALARAGVPRDETEPIEAFATRLARRDEPWAIEAAAALAIYAGLRYGGVGDEASVTKTLDHAARAIP